MNKVKKFITLLALIAVLGGSYIYKKTTYDESKLSIPSSIAPNLEIDTPYAFATTSNAKTGAVFMTIKNPNTIEDELVDVLSFVAEQTEIHQNIIDPDDGKMMMRKVRSITIPKEGEALLTPTGYHIMLINLKRPLTESEEFPLILSFKNLGDRQVTVKVVAAGTIPQHSH